MELDSELMNCLSVRWFAAWIDDMEKVSERRGSSFRAHHVCDCRVGQFSLPKETESTI